MDISVIICTYNRRKNLAGVFDRLAQQTGTDDIAWEVVLVDNNSQDGTRAEVERLASGLPITIRYAFEGQQGLNYARNRGIEESIGDYFVYIDDDILVSEGWLIAMYRALKDNDADAAGGRIHLPPELELPVWIKPDMYGFLGYQDYGDEPFQMDGVKQYPFGGNMGFSRRVVERIGRFNPNLGRKGEGRKRKELFKGAETDFLHRLSASGGEIRYAPGAVVYHMVEPFQIEKRYFRTLHFNRGYQEAFYDDNDYPRRLFDVPLFLYSQALRNTLKYLLALVSQGSDEAFRQQMNVAYFYGRTLGFIRGQTA